MATKTLKKQREIVGTGRAARFLGYAPDGSRIRQVLNSGDLVATKTDGGEWLIEVSELRKYAAIRGILTNESAL